MFASANSSRTSTPSQTKRRPLPDDDSEPFPEIRRMNRYNPPVASAPSSGDATKVHPIKSEPEISVSRARMLALAATRDEVLTNEEYNLENDMWNKTAKNIG
ncbi:hypothetical protein pqer_cds_618 [Pandoravirus quercus]|uniref:Uncharacterized protein n=2 Tax=Pandoravirus TaxID=2060084 RepID=A0A2U7U9I7_9VIRU|nr:hypothetical protein pqer_cds_618 [Pandoravirus quercus]AVK75040.1 hypothetical protein pqer_cds_618 [Pandoravirus quercus]QBZ81260.1 hypothetical protein pclt_cds_673 [Pandoravirus celtis]